VRRLTTVEVTVVETIGNTTVVVIVRLREVVIVTFKAGLVVVIAFADVLTVVVEVLV
jgi:hypothetical protein